MAKKNSYEKKAEQNHFRAVTAHLDTKGSVKNTLIETGKDLLVGVIGGGLIGSAIGKPSLAIGLGVAGVGHYSGSRLVSLLGIGMMAANGFQTKTVSGPQDTMDGIKDRMLAFKDSFSQKLYLDKIMKKKTDAPVAGLGDLQYFNYANEVAGLAALNSIEEQITGSAMSRLPAGDMTNGTVGEAALPAMDGVLADVSDYNL